jgi:hypothetical protein
MTISSEQSQVSYDGDGVSLTSTVPFYFLQNTDLIVSEVNVDGTETLLTLDVDYTVAGAGNPAGGAVTRILTPTPVGKRLLIDRDPPATQETAYQANDPFPAAEHEKALDKLTMLVQRLGRTFFNALHFPLTESTDGTLPQKSARLGMLQGYDPVNGAPIMVPMPASIGAGDMLPYSLVSGVDFAPGATSLTLPRAPGAPANLEVYFDGFGQDFSQWNVVGQTLNIPGGVPVDVTRVWGYIGTTLSTLIPPDDSVGDDQLIYGNTLARHVDTIAALRGLDKMRYQRAFVNGYYAVGDGGGGFYYLDATDTTSPDNGGSIIVATDGARWKLVYTDVLRGEQFGMRGSGDPAHATANTNALLAAIQSLRKNPKLIDKGDAAHTMVTCYATGKIKLGNGVFCINASALNFTQDHGLIIEGNGSRGASGSNRGNTVLLYKGTTGAYVLRVDGNGARGFQMRGLDLCYDNSGFVGGLVDLLTTVGWKFEDVYFGSFNFSLATTVTSAAWLIRFNEYEVGGFDKCVFHGGALGWYFDDAAGGSGWLGNGITATNCWFYDFTDAHIRADGAKTSISVKLQTVGFNPINVGPTRCLNVKNMDGFSMKTCTFQSSSGAAPTTEWARILDSQGSIEDCTFGEFAKAGTFSGHLHFASNNTASPDGWTFLQGSISTDNNRFDNCSVAINLVSQVDTLHVDLRNDRFGAGVTTSYRCADGSSLISGRIAYAKSRDFSVGKFSNLNDQVEITGEGTQQVAGALGLTNADTGKTFFLNAGAVVTLPNPITAGVSFKFVKTASGSARVDAAAVGQLYTGDGAAKTSLVATNGADIGRSFSVRSFGNTAWACTSRSDGWTAS